MSDFDIQTMEDIVDIRGPKYIEFSWLELFLFLGAVCLVLFFCWYIWKKYFRKQKIQPQIDIFELKYKELNLLKKKLDKCYQTQDKEEFVLIATHIIKLQKEIYLREKLLHTTTTEFEQKIEREDSLLKELDGYKYSEVTISTERMDFIYKQLI